MADAALHAARRRWVQTGSLEDEVAYLHARVRAGDLSAESVRFAAHCGGRAAAIVASDMDLPPAPPPRGGAGGAGNENRDWAWSPIVLDDHERLGRIAVAAARSVAADEPEGSELLGSAVSWLACPCPNHQGLAEVAWRDGPRALAASGAALAAAWINPVVVADGLWIALHRAARRKGWPHVRSAVAAEVVPWALGYLDPIRVRP